MEHTMIVGQYVTQQKAYGEPKRGVVEQIISTDKDDNEIEMAQVAWDDGTDRLVACQRAPHCGYPLGL